MGYANIREDKRHKEDAARIKELEAQLKKERESRSCESSQNQDQCRRDDPKQSQTVVVNNEGCCTSAGKGCLLVVIGFLVLAAVGQLISILASK